MEQLERTRRDLTRVEEGSSWEKQAAYLAIMGYPIADSAKEVALIIRTLRWSVGVRRSGGFH